MRRREFIAVLVTAQLALQQCANAEGADAKLPRIGILLIAPSENSDALIDGLRKAGYLDGQNVLLEKRFHGTSLHRIDEFASELAALECRLIFAASPYAIRAATKATRTIPIVGVDLETDPVASGWAQSLARPGGNLTGVFLDIPELGGKLVDFAREVVPGLSRLGVLWDAAIGSAQIDATEAAARTAGLTLNSLPIRDAEQIKAEFDRAAGDRTQCVLVLSSPLFFRQRSQIAELALDNRLPTVSLLTSVPKVGGLLGYGPNLASMFGRAASHIDRIIRGAKPGDLPIERPSKFELIINVKSAHALGLDIPEPLLARADEVIE
ncbi:MAG TPA: ABC transporter substrate-binding protein [Stellaceae bacterium]